MKKTKQRKLWQIKHPYYCAEGNYFSNEMANSCDSWEEFLEEMGDADEELNLLFRWDWLEGSDNDVPNGESLLLLFYMAQRKAKCYSYRVAVTRNDEPAVRAWLREKKGSISVLWEGL